MKGIARARQDTSIHRYIGCILVVLRTLPTYLTLYLGTE